MRNAISEFLPYTEKDKETIWDEGTYVFDTNVLLNLYRYSRETREDLLGAFAKLSDRIWMPYHVAYEFMKNRRKVIIDTIDDFDKAIGALIEETQKRLSALRVDKSYIKQIQNYQQRKLNDYKTKNFDVTDADADEILASLLSLFENNVGAKYTEDELSKLKKAAADRYDKSIPPGYKDAKKAKEDKHNDNNAYGDYIIWAQMMSFAKDIKKDLVFVVDDRKEDWWEIHNGKHFGARQEMLAEFYNVTGKRFLIYTMHTFLERLNNLKGFDIDPKTIEEANSISRSLQISEGKSEKMTLSQFIIISTLRSVFSNMRKKIEGFDFEQFNDKLIKTEWEHSIPKQISSLNAQISSIDENDVDEKDDITTDN